MSSRDFEDEKFGFEGHDFPSNILNEKDDLRPMSPCGKYSFYKKLTKRLSKSSQLNDVEKKLLYLAVYSDIFYDCFDGCFKITNLDELKDFSNAKDDFVEFLRKKSLEIYGFKESHKDNIKFYEGVQYFYPADNFNLTLVSDFQKYYLPFHIRSSSLIEVEELDFEKFFLEFARDILVNSFAIQHVEKAFGKNLFEIMRCKFSGYEVNDPNNHYSAPFLRDYYFNLG